MSERGTGRPAAPHAGASPGEQPLPRRRIVVTGNSAAGDRAAGSSAAGNAAAGNAAAGNAGTSSPPVRPPVASSLPLPTSPEVPAVPRAVRSFVALWWAGCAVAVLGLLALLEDRGALEDRLTATATSADPTATAEAVADSVRMTIALMVAAVALCLAVSLVWVAQIRRRRGWARWALVMTGLPTLLSLDIAQSVAAGSVDVDRIALIAAAALLLAALLALLRRSARAWFGEPTR